MWLPGAGNCSRATPLPTALISSPDCWAVSTADRNDLPKNDGTTKPLSTSRTTVPLPAACSAAVACWGVAACADSDPPAGCAGGGEAPEAGGTKLGPFAFAVAGAPGLAWVA